MRKDSSLSFCNVLQSTIIVLAIQMVMSVNAYAGPQYTLGCNSCHANPPLDSADLVTRNPDSGAFVGNHQRHMPASPVNPQQSCAICHVSAGFTTGHLNGKISFQANINNSPKAGGAQYRIGSTTYGGSVFKNQTSVPQPLGTCSGVNCHFETVSSTWGAANFSNADNDCNNCHDYASPSLSSAHKKHLEYWSWANNGCSTCHPDYKTGLKFSHATSAGNRGIKVVMSDGAYNGTGLNYLPSQSGVRSLGSCTTLYCHSDGKASGASYKSPGWADGALNCLGCHGGASSNTLSGKHQAHVNNSAVLGSNFGCIECHAKTVSSDSTISNLSRHVNRLRDYSGIRAGRNAACTSFYCHSNGKGFYVNPGTWTAGPAISDCKGCHGTSTGAGTFLSVAGEPNYASVGIGQPTSNSHKQHVGSTGAATCDTCHTQTTTSGTAIKSGSTLHVNSAINVTFNTTKAGTNAQYLIGRICSNIICHGNNNVAWGETLSCGSCHLGADDIDDYAYNNGTIAKVKNSGGWDSYGHGRPSLNYPSGNRPAGFTVSNACLYCHDLNVGHGISGNFFRLRSIADPVWGKNGACMNCHAEGSAGISVDGVLKNAESKITSYHYGGGHTAQRNSGQFCWDCHDTHGDSNIFMVHSMVAVTSDTATGIPTSTAATVFTSYINGSSYAKTSSPFNGICNVCHTTTQHYTATSGDGHGGSNRCTDCHSHNNTNKLYAFAASESSGGKACGTCHKDRYATNQAAYSMHSNIAQIGYKHYMTNDAATYSTQLPNGPDQNPDSRRCTMCHVDHDMFKVPATATAGRAFNLRPDATKPPTKGTNTDLPMCATCHFQVWTKAIPTPNNENKTMPIPFPNVTYQNATSIVKSSTHGYLVPSQLFADATLGDTTFQANCVKCHNDSIGRNGGPGEGNKSSVNGQDGTVPGRYKFGQHMGNIPNFYSVFNSNFFQGLITSYNPVAKSIFVSGANWAPNQWAYYYVIIIAGSGQNQREMVITGNTSDTIYLQAALPVALDHTSVIDIAQFPVSHDYTCFACHSKNNQDKFNGAGKDWYGSQAMKPALESIKDLFVSDQGVTTAADSGGSNDPAKVIDSSKSWIVNQWTNYNVRFESGSMKGQVRKVASNTGNTLVLYTARQLRTRIESGTIYRIYKPAMHPIDTYGRHKTFERITSARTFMQGDTGVDTALTGPTSNVTTITDTERYWKTNQWAGMRIYFPTRDGLYSTITGNTETSVTFTPGQSLDMGEPYHIGTRHASCTDCHSSHAALDHPSGTVTSVGTNTLTSSNAVNPRWVTDQWKGFLIKVRQYTGSTDNGREQIRYITGFNPVTGTFTVSLPWNTAAFTINSDDQFLVFTGDKWTASGQDAGRAGEGSSGIWGVTAGNWQTPAAGNLQDPATITYSKVNNVYDRTGTNGGSAVTGQRDLCVRCHSYYAFGTTRSTTNTSGPKPKGTSGTGGAAPYSGPTATTDIAVEFNPNNASHHAVYARGKNQPIRANYGNTSAGYGSYYNPNWPKYSTTTAGHTVGISNGTATLNGGAQLPGTVLPGWFLYVGADSVSGSSSAVVGTGTTTNGTGFLEITSILSQTQFTVRAQTSTGSWVNNPSLSTATANWFVSGGIGNTFVPPYGPWSVLSCTDCHGSTKTDPLGPHASANDWLLKTLDTDQAFEWYNGSTVEIITPNSGVNSGTNEWNIFCYNCHRRDVYKNNLYTTAPNQSQSRVQHNLMICSGNGLTYEPSAFLPQGWQVWCRHCHGGDTVGGMHGTNATFQRGANGITSGTPTKRFLNGASWDGYGKPDTVTQGACYSKSAGTNDNVSNCNKGHSGNGGANFGTAYYNYW